MCQIIVINKGEKEIETPRQFKKHFGFMPDGGAKHPEECLCHCDISTELTTHNIEYKTYCGDYYVGMLDKVKGDND